MQVSQPDLVTAIIKHLGRSGVSDLLPRQFNAIIQAANLILDELETPERAVSPGMGLDGWFRSDHTGLSSKFMVAHLLNGRGGAAYAHPHDPSDFGRCLGLLDACPELRPRIHEMATASREWEALVGAWDELESLYREELPSGTAPKCYQRMRELLGE